MKRASLSSLEPEDLIAIVLAHPQAGRYVATMLDHVSDRGGLASSTVVFHGRTVCVRTPGLWADEAEAAVHLLIWHEDHMHPWRIDALRVPRDAAELRLLATAASSARRAMISEPVERPTPRPAKSEVKAA